MNLLGNPGCFKDPSARRGMEMMGDVLRERSCEVPEEAIGTKDGGVWENVVDAVSEWRGSGNLSAADLAPADVNNELSVPTADELEGGGWSGDENDVNLENIEVENMRSPQRGAVKREQYNMSPRATQSEIQSPSGLQFAEGFEEDEKDQDADDSDGGEGKEEEEADAPKLKKKKKLKKLKKKVLKKKASSTGAGSTATIKLKKKKKLSSTTAGTAAGTSTTTKTKTKKRINVQMEIPAYPAAQTKLTTKQKKTIIRGRASPSLSPPPAYMSMQPEDFEKVRARERDPRAFPPSTLPNPFLATLLRPCSAPSPRRRAASSSSRRRKRARPRVWGTTCSTGRGGRTSRARRRS